MIITSISVRRPLMHHHHIHIISKEKETQPQNAASTKWNDLILVFLNCINYYVDDLDRVDFHSSFPHLRRSGTFVLLLVKLVTMKMTWTRRKKRQMKIILYSTASQSQGRLSMHQKKIPHLPTNKLPSRKNKVCSNATRVLFSPLSRVD